MHLTVLIPTCNRRAALAACLERVRESIRQSGRTDTEILVSDDSADPALLAPLRAANPDITWGTGPRRGPGANRNAGVAQASGRWILFVDDDCLPAEGWVGAYLAAMRAHPEARVLEGRVVSDREARRCDEEAPLNHAGGVLWTCNIAIEREFFVRLGGFCEGFSVASEDSDLRLRIEKLGHVTPFVADAVVCHPIRPSKGIGFQVEAGRNLVLLYERHPELFNGAPLRTIATSIARVAAWTARDLWRFRFRGSGYALARWAIYSYYSALAAVRHAAGLR